jgi:uroporphyrinogen decarboxylase
MTNRERILAAIAHREPDRVPVDLGATESSGLTGMAWHRLAGHLRMARKPGPDILEPFQQVVRIGDDLRERFEIDTTALFPEPKEWKAGRLGDGSPCRVPSKWYEVEEANGDRLILGAEGQPSARMPSGGFYFDPVASPLADCQSASELERHRTEIEAFDLPAFCDEGVAATAARAAELHSETESAIVFNICCHFLAAGTILRGYEQFMIDLIAEPEIVDALMEMLLGAYMKRVDLYAPTLAANVDVLLFNDDLGTQNGPIIAPDLYRKVIKPRQAKLFQHAKQAFDAPILFHSCGAVREFIPDLIEAGVDALNPVQVSAAGMDSAQLKQDFGKDICFWGGGCDTQNVLARGKVQDVRDEVKKRIDDFAPGGGFVFNQVHNIQADVPPENIVAMLEAAHEFGG